MRKEEAREEKMSGESRESSVQRQIDGDGLIGEWEERYGKKKKKPDEKRRRKNKPVQMNFTEDRKTKTEDRRNRTKKVYETSE